MATSEALAAVAMERVRVQLPRTRRRASPWLWAAMERNASGAGDPHTIQNEAHPVAGGHGDDRAPGCGWMGREMRVDMEEKG